MGAYLGYDPRMAICAIVVIPVFIWWIRQRIPQGLKWFGIYVIAMFIHGSLDLTGAINATVLRYAFELPLLYLYVSMDKTSLERYPGRGLVIPLIIVSCISAIQTSGIMLILFLLYFLEVFMLLLYFRNRFKGEDAIIVNKLFWLLAVSQIFAAVIKYNMVGVMEPYIGSMSSHEGGITTVFALVMYCYALEMYFVTKKKIYVLAVLGFVLFGIVGEKRALAFFFPSFYFVVLIVHSYFTGNLHQNLKNIILGLITMPFLFVLLCILNPSFNPEREVGGSFDLEYVLDYSDKYNHGDLSGNEEGGRADAMAILHAKMLNDDLFHQAFGYGSGSLIPSSFNSLSNDDETRMSKYGVGYAMGIGYLSILAQIGFIGVVMYFMIFIMILSDLIKQTRRYGLFMESLEMASCVIAIITTFCIIFISFIYNKTSFFFNCASVLNMWFIAYAYITLDKVRVRLG